MCSSSRCGDAVPASAPTTSCSRRRRVAFSGPATSDAGSLIQPLLQQDWRISARTTSATPPRASSSPAANVKAVQRMLGHPSAAMTLDVYSGLFDDDLGALADRMDLAHEALVTRRHGA